MSSSSFYSGTVTTTDTTAIENSKDAAADSATAAAASETAAAASASSASTSASSASTSATTATTKASEASTSASNAATSETNAATSETNAATSETNAATSETNAATSETNAATSETNAATSETNAATSETNAATSETNAAASFDSFDDRFLGAKATEPTTDNDGDDLLTGAIYYNTGNNKSRVYNGASWQDVAPTTITTVDTSNLGNVGDVSLSSVATNDALIYNGNNWVNSADPTFGNLTVSELRGGSTLTIDPAGIGDNTGTVVIAGDLQVDGTTTTINSTTLTVDDKLVTVASGATNASAANGAGIEVDGASASLKYTYNSGNDYWLFNKDVRVKSSSTDNAVFTIQTAADTARSILAMGDSSSSTIGKIEYDHDANDMIFVTGGTTSATLDSSGLDVTGDITLSGTVDGVDIATRDAILSSTKTTADAALPKAGGTITGDLTVSGSLTNINTLQGVGDVNSYSSVAQNDFLVRGASGWDNKAPADARSAMGLGSAALSESTDFASASQGTTAQSALQPGDVVDNLTSTSTTAPLSANQGKVLEDSKIENLVDDTTPELGGNLDVNGNSIVSSSNGNINITPNGSGVVVLDGQSWPTDYGSASQVLTVNSGANGLEWADASSGGGGGGSLSTIYDPAETDNNEMLKMVASTQTVSIPSGAKRAYIFAIGKGGKGGSAAATDGASVAIGGWGHPGSVGLCKIADLDVITDITGLHVTIASGHATVRLNSSTGTTIAAGYAGGNGQNVSTSSYTPGTLGSRPTDPVGSNVTNSSGSASVTVSSTELLVSSAIVWPGAGEFNPRIDPDRKTGSTSATWRTYAFPSLCDGILAPLQFNAGAGVNITSSAFYYERSSFNGHNTPSHHSYDFGKAGIPNQKVDHNFSISNSGGDGGPAGVIILFV